MYKEQEVIINNIKSFELRDIFDCGQCFRWNEEENNSYTGVIKHGVLNVRKENNTIHISGCLDGDINEICN